MIIISIIIICSLERLELVIAVVDWFEKVSNNVSWLIAIIIIIIIIIIIYYYYYYYY